MEKKIKLKILKILIFIIVIAIYVGITIYLFPVMKNLSTVEGQNAFKERVNNSGIGGLLLLFSIQLAQILLFVLPGEPIEILAGMCYGELWGTVFILTSAAIISLLIFILVRKIGKQFIYDFINEEKVKKFENSKVYKSPKKIEIIVLLMFLIPGTPKDFLTYVSALLPIKTLNFVLISTIARIPSVITSTIAGANIADGNWKKGFLIYGIIFAIVLLIIYIYNKFDKDKTTKTILTSIK